MTATSGRKCSGLYSKPGPLGSLVRMLLESSAWNSTDVFLTWRVKATPARRLLFQLAPLTPNTGEIECGLWPTPNGDDANNTNPNRSGEYNSLVRSAGGSLNPTWVEALMGFPLGWTDITKKE